MPKKHERDEVLTPAHYHEALDRTYCIQDHIDRILVDHPAIVQTPQWKVMVDHAVGILADLYISIGEKM